jgi:hypothetical protein
MVCLGTAVVSAIVVLGLEGLMEAAHRAGRVFAVLAAPGDTALDAVNDALAAEIGKLLEVDLAHRLLQGREVFSQHF